MRIILLRRRFTKMQTAQKTAAGWNAIVTEETTRICRSRFGEALRAIVLTGSAARDESTFVEDGGDWKLLGDADFFLVFRDGSPLPDSALVEAAACDVKAALANRSLTACVGLSPVERAYFAKLPRHIATYELRMSGRVIWGSPDVLSSIPMFSAEQISREDAWRMLGNRMIEMLESWGSADSFASAPYRTIKLFLDMATSYLVFAGAYRPTYRDRAIALRLMAEETSAQATAPFPLSQFADRVEKCTRFKLGECFESLDAEALAEDAVYFSRLLWRWELQQLTGDTSDICENKLMSRWMAQQPWRARLRGWASIVRRSGCLATLRELPRWSRFGWRASPRYWIYSVAMEVFRDLSEHGPTKDGRIDRNSVGKLAAQLPVLWRAGWEPRSADWRWLVRTTALNYRCFLEDTTA